MPQSGGGAQQEEGVSGEKNKKRMRDLDAEDGDGDGGAVRVRTPSLKNVNSGTVASAAPHKPVRNESRGRRGAREVGRGEEAVETVTLRLRPGDASSTRGAGEAEPSLSTLPRVPTLDLPFLKVPRHMPVGVLADYVVSRMCLPKMKPTTVRSTLAIAHGGAILYDASLSYGLPVPVKGSDAGPRAEEVPIAELIDRRMAVEDGTSIVLTYRF